MSHYISSLDSYGNAIPILMIRLRLDLRQDMLTLLSLRLMENVWRKSNLDYGLIPYKCLSTGYQIGMIEVVTQSETLARIQARHGRFGVLSNSSLYTWISNKCNNEE